MPFLGGIKIMTENLLFLILFTTFASLSILFIIVALLKFFNHQQEKPIKKWDSIIKRHTVISQKEPPLFLEGKEILLSQEAKKEINILQDLRSDGIMSQEEFEEQKSKVIEKSKLSKYCHNIST